MLLQAEQDILNGKYHIERLVGEGSFARVWLAQEVEFGARQVAIKELRRDRLSDSEIEDQERRFRQEVDLAAMLDAAHVPNVVRALTVERLEDGARLLVLEYMDGGSLAGLLARQPGGIAVPQAVTIAVEVCQALDGLHKLAVGPVHRDIKPSNILLNSKGEARLSDFGLAQMPGASGRSMGAGAGHPGTPNYMAPEQAMSPLLLTPAADVYALGCVLFELLTGKLYVRQRPGTPPSKLRPDSPPWLDRVLAKMLEADPWSRYESAGEAAAALQGGQAAAEAAQAEAQAKAAAEAHARADAEARAKAEAEERARREAEEAARREGEARAQAAAAAQRKADDEARARRAAAEQEERRRREAPWQPAPQPPAAPPAGEPVALSRRTMLIGGSVMGAAALLAMGKRVIDGIAPTPTPTPLPTATRVPPTATKPPAAATTAAPAAAPTTKAPAAAATTAPAVPPTATTSVRSSAGTWMTKASLPAVRGALALVAAGNGKLYAIGGYHISSGANVYLATVEEYDPTTDRWTRKASMPTARASLGAAVASNGRIYAIGGQEPKTAAVEEYNPATDAWASRASMPTARCFLGVSAARNGRIYAIGGDNIGTNEEFNPETNSWATRRRMLAAYWTMAVVAANNGKIYAIGGGDARGVTDAVQEYNPDTDNWTMMTPLPVKRGDLAAAPLNDGRILVVGGRDDANNVYSEAHVYDPSTNAWSRTSNMPTARLYLAAAAVPDGKVYVAGGTTITSVLATLEVYVPS